MRKSSCYHHLALQYLDCSKDKSIDIHIQPVYVTDQSRQNCSSLV